ncbi:Ger(x)C family spore germination C-terminal domain-containing protein [Paenibacillus sp. N3.4]|uniref:Ger(x)C family spore germination C-terminal domain-containing protein n=1 Tax=Paenibacillus sp. N3.4 TaxID=2603222 RepID=UPI0021C30BDC|nr:Ger(x)C family spore germination C-terminal domain-containing protein [Paenibacillus sp. N3.4]
MTLSIPGNPKPGTFDTNKISIGTNKVKTKIKTSYLEGKFHFDIEIKIAAGLTERYFPYDMKKNGKQLEKMAGEQVQKQMENLIKKIQENKIDPIGLGLYARANEYSRYVKVEDHWGEALAEADIHVSVKVGIASWGPVK